MNEDIMQELLSHIIGELRAMLLEEHHNQAQLSDDNFLYLGYLSYKEFISGNNEVSSLVEEHVKQYPESLLHWIWWNSKDGQIDLKDRVDTARECAEGFDFIDELSPHEDFDLAYSVAQVMYKKLVNQAETEYLKTLQIELNKSNAEKVELKSTFDNLVGLTFSYRSSKKFFDFLRFNVKLKNYSPFNVALIYTQNQNAEYVATKKDWEKLHNRIVAYEAKPMIILAPFHPILMVFDIRDTSGEPLPERCFSTFWAEGYLPTKELSSLEMFLRKFKVKVDYKHLDITQAGYIQNVVNLNADDEPHNSDFFSLIINASHTDIVKFATLVHEIGHLLCGHLGSLDGVKDRRILTLTEREFEAESISYIVCSRLGIRTNSDEYLSGYVQNENFIPKNVSVDLILKISSKIEQVVKADSSGSNSNKSENYKVKIDMDKNGLGQLSLFMQS